MKKIFIMLIAVLALSAFDAKAQGDLKFAHVKSDSVLINIGSYKAIMAEQKAIESKFKKRSEKIQEDLYKLEMELDSIQNDPNSDDIDLQLLAKEYRGKQEDGQIIEYNRQNELGILSQRMEKLMIRYREVVGKVAAELGITYVFDESQQILYAGPKSKDITEQVKAAMIKLDLEDPVHTFPAQ